MPHDRIGQLIRLKPKQSPQDIGVAVDWREWVRHRAAMLAALAVILAAVGIVAWTQLGTNPLPPGIAFSNGRLEADRIDIATKLAGRIKAVLVQEGDTVAAGQVLARMDTTELEAQIREAEAGTTQAEQQRLADRRRRSRRPAARH
jgi:HlyD family secretion protein